MRVYRYGTEIRLLGAGRLRSIMSANRNHRSPRAWPPRSAAASPAFAQNNDQLGGAPAQRMTVPDANAADVTQELTLTVNKSYMIEFDTDIDDVIVANPAIANVVARDRRRVAVMGVAPGESNIVFLDRSGRKLKVLEVSVTDGVAGMDQLRGLIKRHVPGAKVQVEAVNGRIILAGRVPNLVGVRPRHAARQALRQGRDQRPQPDDDRRARTRSR